MAGREVTAGKKRKHDLDGEDVRGKRDNGAGSGSGVSGDDDQKPPVARVIGVPRFYDGSDPEANRIISEQQRPQFYSPAKYRWVEQLMASEPGDINIRQAGTEYDLWMYHQQLVQRTNEVSNTVQGLAITRVSSVQPATVTIKPEPTHSLRQVGDENTVDPSLTITDDDDEVQEIGRKNADEHETTVINPPTQVVTTLRRPKPEPVTDAFPTVIPPPSVAFKRVRDTATTSATGGAGIDFTGPSTPYAMLNAGATSIDNASTAATEVKTEPVINPPLRQQQQPQVQPDVDRSGTDRFMRKLLTNMKLKPLPGPQADILAQIAGQKSEISAGVRQNGGTMCIPQTYAAVVARTIMSESSHVYDNKAVHIYISGYGILQKNPALYERAAKGGDKIEGPLVLKWYSRDELESTARNSLVNRTTMMQLERQARHENQRAAAPTMPNRYGLSQQQVVSQQAGVQQVVVKYDPTTGNYVKVKADEKSREFQPLETPPPAKVLSIPSQPPLQPPALVPSPVAMQHQPPTVTHPFMPVQCSSVTLGQPPMVMQQPARVIQQQPVVPNYPFMATVPPPNMAYPPPPVLQARNRAVLPPFEQMNIAPINGAGPSTTPKPVYNEVIQFGASLNMVPVQNPCPVAAYRVVAPSKAGGMASSRSRHHLAPQPTQQPVQVCAPVMEVVPVPIETLNAEACATSVFTDPDNHVNGDTLVFQDWKNIHNRQLWERTLLQESKREVCETSIFTLRQRGMGDYNVGLSKYVKIPYAVYAWEYPTSDDPSQYLLAQQLWNVNMAFNPLTFPDPPDDTVPPGIQECRKFMRNILTIPDGGTNWLKSLTAFLSNLRKIERQCLEIMAGWFLEMGGLSKRDLIRFVGWIVFTVQRIVSNGMTTCRMVCAEYSPLVTLPLRQQYILDGQYRHIETNETDRRRHLIPRKLAAKSAMETRVFTTCGPAERNQMEQAGRLLFDLFQPIEPPSHDTKLVMIWEARQWTGVFDDLYARHPDLAFHIREMIRINGENDADRDLHALIMKRY